MVTIKDISKKSGFSITTVSKALNDYSDISPKTKKLILGLANEMNYIPNSQARSLVTQKSYTIGIIFHENSGIGLQHPLFSKILESFKTEVERAGYDLLFLAHKTGGQMGSYLQHSIRKQVEGIFVLCADFYSEELFELYSCIGDKISNELRLIIVLHTVSKLSSLSYWHVKPKFPLRISFAY